MTNKITLAKCEQRDISGHGAEEGACIDGQNRAQAPAAPHDGQKKKLGEQNKKLRKDIKMNNQIDAGSNATNVEAEVTVHRAAAV